MAAGEVRSVVRHCVCCARAAAAAAARFALMHPPRNDCTTSETLNLPMYVPSYIYTDVLKQTMGVVIEKHDSLELELQTV